MLAVNRLLYLVETYSVPKAPTAMSAGFGHDFEPMQTIQEGSVGLLDGLRIRFCTSADQVRGLASVHLGPPPHRAASPSWSGAFPFEPSLWWGHSEGKLQI